MTWFYLTHPTIFKGVLCLCFFNYLLTPGPCRKRVLAQNVSKLNGVLHAKLQLCGSNSRLIRAEEHTPEYTFIIRTNNWSTQHWPWQRFRTYLWAGRNNILPHYPVLPISTLGHYYGLSVYECQWRQTPVGRSKPTRWSTFVQLNLLPG